MQVEGDWFSVRIHRTEQRRCGRDFVSLELIDVQTDLARVSHLGLRISDSITTHAAVVAAGTRLSSTIVPA